MSDPTLPRWKPSVTVAAVIERDGRFLLVEEHTPEGLRLNNPAGHLDPGESPAQGCARETLEETAHTFTPTALVGIYLSRFQRGDERHHLSALCLLRRGGRIRPGARAGHRHRAHAVAHRRRDSPKRRPPPQPAGAAVHGGLLGRTTVSAGPGTHRCQYLGRKKFAMNSIATKAITAWAIGLFHA